MNYSIEFLADFAERLTALDNEYKSAVEQYNKQLNSINSFSESSRKRSVASAVADGMKICAEANASVADLFASESRTASGFLADHSNEFSLLSRYNMTLSLIRNVENTFTNPKEYEHFREAKKYDYTLTPQSIIDDEERLLEMIYSANLALMGANSAEKKKKCSALYCYCAKAQSILEEQIMNLRRNILSDKANAVTECKAKQQATDEHFAGHTDFVSRYFTESSDRLEEQYKSVSEKVREMTKELDTGFQIKLRALQQGFLNEFPVSELSEEYDRISRSEPNYNDYHCTDDIPRTIRIGSFVYDLSNRGFSDFTLSLLDRFYSFMYNGKKLTIPHCAAFDGAVDMLFRYGGNATDAIRDLANGIALRLFMMTQLGKVNFTFYDPVALGGSFVDFSGLVNIDDHSASLINGKIWTSTEDIEDRLHDLSEHISGITQRCLRGQFSNIYEYNKEAGINAEPYQVIFIMDYPAALSDNALRLIEQIAQSGSKCGVFILLFESTNQRRQLKNYSVTLSESLESYFPVMQYDSDSGTFSAVLPGKDLRIDWYPCDPIQPEQKDSIFETLRDGISSMKKAVVGLDRLKNAETSDCTADGIRVPVGISGVNSVQYLTLGRGSCNHALIAGIAGMGKSSLLHTVIMQCLNQYSPEELNIYLVDFKRGIEFKVYADFRIPHFKVISVESEREFGYNVLKAVDREQKVRADIFKNSGSAGHIERINEFRKNGGKMPRILVIMDEFHELFTQDDEISRQSAVLMERIVRQGRAFGIHLILSSQSYANIKGLEKAVYDQMAVRMVMKCSADDADMLLENGSGMVALISADDTGKVIYNSDSGSKSACNMFQAAYIRPEEHKVLLKNISAKYSAFPDGGTRILLSNVEDNVFSKFNRFAEPDYVDDGRQLIIGESLDLVGGMKIGFTRSPRSNLLLIGDNTDKARTLFCFAILSQCIDCWLKNGKRPPERPIIRLFNFKPLNDDYFVDTLAAIAGLLPDYIKNTDCSSLDEINADLAEAYSACTAENDRDICLAIFGYQRAEALRSGTQHDIGGQLLSPAEMLTAIIKNGPENGVHTLIWQDKLSGLPDNYADFISLFNMRIAFDMSKDALHSFVMEDNCTETDENSAIYYNSLYDNQKFRVYQSPHIDWVRSLCDKLHSSPER